jgi:hypothetical protein
MRREEKASGQTRGWTEISEHTPLLACHYWTVVSAAGRQDEGRQRRRPQSELSGVNAEQRRKRRHREENQHCTV